MERRRDHSCYYPHISSYHTPIYGSGSWDKVNDLNSCLQTCHATFGGGGGEASPPSNPGQPGEPREGESPSNTQPAGPATHTIIVAPTQGVLRYVPFAVNANPGDKLHFIWGAGPHTVTLSDGQNVCNKSTTSLAFDSGKLNATQTFEQVVGGNASTPQFYYCTVMTHCSKGMFGLINPPLTNVTNELTDQATKTAPPIGKQTAGSGGGSTCVGESMECWIDRWQYSGSAAKQKYDGVKSKCASQPKAWEWGNKWDMSKWETTVVTKEVIIENVMYTRRMLATNPSMLDATQPFPADWKAAPELNSFVTSSNATDTAGVNANTVVSSASPSSSASASAGPEADSAGAQAPNPSSGNAGRRAIPLSGLITLSLGGLFAAMGL